MTNYLEIAREIIDTIELDELYAADLAIHLDLEFDEDANHVISMKNQFQLVRYIDLERNENNQVIGHTFYDCELDEDGYEYGIAEGGGPIDNLKDLAGLLQDMAEFPEFEY